MAEHNYDEKEMEKHDEKAEKSYDEKHRTDPLGSLVGAAFLIWIGVVLLAANTGFLNQVNIGSPEIPFDFPFVGARTWTVFFLGGGIILFVELLVRIFVPTYRRPLLGTIIGCVVFFALSLGRWSLVWPLVVVAIGVSMLLSGLIGRR